MNGDVCHTVFIKIAYRIIDKKHDLLHMARKFPLEKSAIEKIFLSGLKNHTVITPHKQTIGYIRTKRQTIKKKI